MPAVAVETTRTTRGPRRLSLFSCWLVPVISTCCVGLLSGAAGGLLLGRTAVVLLESLELLAENKLLMNQLENYIMDDAHPYVETRGEQGERLRPSNDSMNNIFVSLLVQEFAVFSSSVSLAGGILIGRSTYESIIKKYGETAMGKALALAGPVCLTAVTAAGCILGLVLEGFLTIVSTIDVLLWFYIAGCLTGVYFFCCATQFAFIAALPLVNTPLFVTGLFLITTFSISRVTLLVSLNRIMEIVSFVEVTSVFEGTVAPLLPMLIITDVFNFARQPIITLHTPENITSAVEEGLFVGLFTVQLMMVVVGMSLFVSWQKGGATKIWAGAAALGGAVIAAVELILHVLGPGPTVGALMGVSGAAGVSLAAAGALTDQFRQVESCWPGRLGTTVGAAAGAFLTSSSHTGLSKMFIVLSAATLPAGSSLIQLLMSVFERDTGGMSTIFSCLFFTLFFGWLCFTLPVIIVMRKNLQLLYDILKAQLYDK